MLHDHYGLGGAERILDSLRAGLVARGHEVRLLCPASESEPSYSCWSSSNPLFQLANPSAWWVLRRALREFQPHVVHLHMVSYALSPLVLSLLKDVPALHYLMLYELNCPRGTKWRTGGGICRERSGLTCLQCLSPQAWVAIIARLRLLRAWRTRVDRLIPLSEHLRQVMETDGIACGPVIHPGTADPGPGPTRSRPELLYAGRFVPEKGIQVVREAFVRLREAHPEARLVVCGDGPCRPDSSPDVEVTGRLSREQLSERMRHCRLVVVPSLWEEPFGCVAVEAAAHGKVAVVSDHGGLREIVRHENTGLCVEAGCSELLADALKRVWNDDGLRCAMGKAARQRYLDHFTEDRMIGRLEAQYLEIAKGVADA